MQITLTPTNAYLTRDTELIGRMVNDPSSRTPTSELQSATNSRELELAMREAKIQPGDKLSTSPSNKMPTLESKYSTQTILMMT